MELTREDLENIYANVTLHRGMFVLRNDFASKACELFPGCGMTAENIEDYLDKHFENVRYSDDFTDTDNAPKQRAFRLNASKVKRYTSFRELLMRSVIKVLRKDGWGLVSQLYNIPLTSALQDLHLYSASYALSLQPLAYELSVEGGNQIVRPIKFAQGSDVPALIAELDHEIETQVIAHADAEGWTGMAQVSSPRISELINVLSMSNLQNAFAELWPDKYEISAEGASKRVRILNRTSGHSSDSKTMSQTESPKCAADEKTAAELKAEIERLIENEKDDDGWMHMAKANSPKLKELLKAVGYSKLGQAIRNLLSDTVEIAPVNPNFPTGAQKIHVKEQARARSQDINNDKEKIKSKESDKGEHPKITHITDNLKPLAEINKKKSAYDKLIDFALIFPYNDIIKKLADKALPETWHFGKSGVENYSILKNYFQLTFERLVFEDIAHKSDRDWEPKIRISQDKLYCIFNTGLVDRLYEPIYAYFGRNTKPSKDGKDMVDWVFKGFVGIEDSATRQSITRIFGAKLPEPAHYYDTTDELVFNIKWPIGTINWTHITERCERLPYEFLNENIPWLEEVRNDKGAIDYKELSSRLKLDSRILNRIKNRIEDAIELSLKRVRWNFKTAIPIYYPAKHNISLLLPLSLADSGEGLADVAMVFEATDSEAYIGHTILTLKMAYNNARLITRPDSDWLTASQIDTGSNDSSDSAD